jgi:hypothetical protein
MIERAKKLWFVSFKKVDARREHARQTETFATEIEAKHFARSKLDDRLMFAGTINPHRPKRTISPGQIADWLEEE